MAVVALAPYIWIAMVHDSSSHSALANPPARPRHALNDAMVGLEPEFGPLLDFEPKQINAGTCVIFGRPRRAFGPRGDTISW
jgi:hypothetical protein